MKKFILLMILSANVLSAQISQEWERKYNGPGNNLDVGVTAQTDNSGNVYVTSAVNGTSSGNYDILTTKYDGNGNQIWEKLYSNNLSAYPTDMEIDNSGNIIVLGYVSDLISAYDIITIKYDSEGNEIWKRIYNSSQNGSERSYDLFIDVSGNIYIAGSTFLNGTEDILTLKYDQSGTLIFNRNFNGASNNSDDGKSVSVDKSGNVYVAGYTKISDNNYDYVLLKYGPGGNTLWGRFYDDIYNREDFAAKVKIDNLGNAIVSGSTYNENVSSDITTLKFNSSGDLLWTRIFSKTSNSYEYFDDMKLDNTNNVYVCGNSSGFNNFYYPVIVKYNENGNQEFLAQYESNAYYNSRTYELDISNNIYLNATKLAPEDSTYRNYLLRFNQQGNLVHNSSITFEDRSYTIARDMCLDNFGKIYVAGSSAWVTEGTGADVMLLKFDTTGTNIWQNYYLGEGFSNDNSSAMIKDSFGNIYVTGSGSYGSHTSFITLKYKPDGSLVWKKIFNRREGVNDAALAIANDNNGNVIVAGYTNVSGTNSDILIVKYDSNGVEQWFADYNGPGNGEDKPAQIMTDNSGNIYLTGKSLGSGTNSDIVTIKLDQNGNQIWTSRYNGSANNADIGYDIILDNQNNVYVTGSGNEASNGIDGVTIKYNSSGIQQWVKTYNGEGSNTDIFRKIKMDSQNKIYVGGETYTIATSADYLTVKYDSDGNQIWEKKYNGPVNNLDKINDMTIQNDNIYITGESVGSGTTIFDYFTIKYDAAGNEIWNARFNGSGGRSDRAYAIEADFNGNVYVTGESYVSGSNTEFVTIKYNSNGSQDWLMRYNGDATGIDVPADIIVNQTDEVYLTGTASNLISAKDIVTLKYSMTSGIQNVNSTIPSKFMLSQNYPNPFNPNTKITFSISKNVKSETSNVKLTIYSALGKEVKVLVNENKPAGSYTVDFDGSNFPSGVYFYRLEVGGNLIDTKRMILLK